MTPIAARTLQREPTTVHTDQVEELRERLRGPLLTEGEEGYEEARSVFNAMIDKRPALIARCAGSADVQLSVEFAREHDLLVAVRGGGHSISGKSVCDGGLLIDLSLMKGIEVDPEERTARAETGLTLGEFDRTTQSHGLATTLGVVTDTGIAGLTLGGGIGWLNGVHGLACDNVLSAEVVAADGRLMTASASRNDDLFWGLRGAGANFGVVTSLEYRLHPVDKVFGGMIIHPLTDAADVLRDYRECIRGCPDEVSTLVALLRPPGGTGTVLALVACHCGPVEEGKRALEPLRSIGSPIEDQMGPRSYVDMQELLDEGWPPGRRHYWKSSFLPSLGDEAIETLVEAARTRPSPTSAVALQQMHGAAARVGPTETAFPHRREQWDMGFFAQWTDPDATEENVAWARRSWKAMDALVDRGVYVNNLGDEGEDRVRAAYGPNYDRLARVKAKYDPDNLFRMNQNIEPTV